jgi:hypothetical protein
VSESGEKDLFERMVERVLGYRPKTARKPKKKRNAAKKKKKQKKSS